MPRRLLIVAALGLAACAGPSGVATNPPFSAPASTPTPSVNPGPQQSGLRTVLSPLGLNLRSGPLTTAPVLAPVAQGVELTVIGYTATGGGWYHVHGATMTGWITADPTLSAPGSFTPFSSSALSFAILYPEGWTFAQEPADIVFRQQSGSVSLVVRVASSSDALGPAGGTGWARTSDREVVVCGVTGELRAFDQRGTPSPVSAAAPVGSRLAQIRLALDGSHLLEMDFNYSNASDLAIFADFYNSITFPFPQCEAPASTPSPSPA